MKIRYNFYNKQNKSCIKYNNNNKKFHWNTLKWWMINFMKIVCIRYNHNKKIPIIIKQKCYFRHKQPLEVIFFILSVIIYYSLLCFLVLFNISCAWPYAFIQQLHANYILPNVNVFCVSPTFFFLIKICVNRLLVIKFKQFLS